MVGGHRRVKAKNETGEWRSKKVFRRPLKAIPLNNNGPIAKILRFFD